MDAVVHHTTHELRRGLQCALEGAITPQLREVEQELRLAGFLTERHHRHRSRSTVPRRTPARHHESRVAAA